MECTTVHENNHCQTKLQPHDFSFDLKIRSTINELVMHHNLFMTQVTISVQIYSRKCWEKTLTNCQSFSLKFTEYSIPILFVGHPPKFSLPNT